VTWESIGPTPCLEGVRVIDFSMLNPARSRRRSWPEGPFAQDRGHDSDFMARCEPAEVADYIKANAPYYFVPRYIDFVDALPLNGHGGVMKNELSASRSAHHWDANAAGYDLRGG
jgi:acyl-CoA synthetase (AMP-forming)/AMP-acid ligase II